MANQVTQEFSLFFLLFLDGVISKFKSGYMPLFSRIFSTLHFKSEYSDALRGEPFQPRFNTHNCIFWSNFVLVCLKPVNCVNLCLLILPTIYSAWIVLSTVVQNGDCCTQISELTKPKVNGCDLSCEFAAFASFRTRPEMGYRESGEQAKSSESYALSDVAVYT